MKASARGITRRGYRLLILVPILGCLACPGSTTVTVTSAAASVHSGQRTSVSAAVSNAPTGPVVGTRVNWTSGPSGTVAPPMVATNAQGISPARFTGGAVNVDTPVTVTATAVAAGSTVIIVKPSIAWGDFGGGTGTTPPTSDINVAPSLVPGGGVGGLLRCIYVITFTGGVTPSATPTTVSVDFETPMTLVSATSTPGGVTSTSANGDRSWLFRIPNPNVTPPYLNWGSMTITLDTDGVPGGTANFDFVEDSGPVLGHLLMRVAGPM